MFFWHKIYYNLLYLPIKFLVKSKCIPLDPVKELRLDIKKHFLYILPYYSKIELLVLRKQCSSIGLSDPLTLIEINKTKLPSVIFIDNHSHVFSSSPNLHKDSIKTFMSYIDLHHVNPKLNIQILPVLTMLGRNPEREGCTPIHQPRLFYCFQKLFAIFWLGRDSFIQFSHAISFREIANQYGTADKIIANKFARMARIYYFRQRLTMIGPKLIAHNDLFNKLLTSKIIKKAIEDESKLRKISFEKAKCNAIHIIKEIAANFSYDAVRISDRILSWTWNRLYQGINVKHIKHVKQLAHNGHEIIYIPSHRSHMDYLLLSYVLYHHGLAPPYIVAGNNLNFWPVGPIFRRLGAFFIRRSFKGNKLYSTIFHEYFNELFARGHSIEYFIEGGRSRTGRLLEPKTGILSMTLQAILRNNSHLITVIPVYIGYEHVLENVTYAKELKGLAKEKDGFYSMLKGLSKLRKLGESYVNFGQSITLPQYLNKYVPEWRKSAGYTESQRPIWLNLTSIQLAHTIMVKINNAAAVNAINLCSTILLASRHHVLTKNQLIEQLECYLQLLRNVPYSSKVIVPNKTAKQLSEKILNLNNSILEHDAFGDLFILSRRNAVLMTYYRNNIIHLLILPSIIANIILQYKKVKIYKINYIVMLIYPLLQAELFMRYNIKELPDIIRILVNELIRQQLIQLSANGLLIVNPIRIQSLQILSTHVSEMLQRYIITLSILTKKPRISRGVLEQESRACAQYLSITHGINAPEFYDKTLFSTLVNTLKKEGYFNKKEDVIVITSLQHLYRVISKLITTEVYLIIKNIRKIINKNK